MKSKVTLFSILALLLAGSCRFGDDRPLGEDSVTSQPSLVVQVRQCSRLYTTEYHIRKIVTHDDILRLRGSVFSQDINIPLPLGERKIAIPMDATVKAYIDFSGFTEANIESDGDHITLYLPDPQVVMTSSKINRQQVREYVGLTRSHFTDKELTSYEQQGRQAILASVKDMGIIEAAQENAARVLVPMLTSMGYKEENITISFRKSLDILQLIRGSEQ